MKVPFLVFAAKIFLVARSLLIALSMIWLIFSAHQILRFYGADPWPAVITMNLNYIIFGALQILLLLSGFWALIKRKWFAGNLFIVVAGFDLLSLGLSLLAILGNPEGRGYFFSNSIALISLFAGLLSAIAAGWLLVSFFSSNEIRAYFRQEERFNNDPPPIETYSEELQDDPER